MTSEEHTVIGGLNVPNILLDEYCDKIVGRLRAIMTRAGMAVAMSNSPDLILKVHEMEMRRQELHPAITDAVGLKKNTPEYKAFQSVFMDYVDERAGSLETHIADPLSEQSIREGQP